MQTPSSAIASELDGAQAAAVLFAANMVQPALDQLLESVRDPNSSRDSAPWLMLLDWYAQAGQLAAFDLVLARYRAAFPTSRVPCRGLPSPVGDTKAVCLEGVLAKPEDLIAVQRRAFASKIVVIDMGGVERIDFAYAGGFASALKNLHALGKRVLLVNVAEAHAVLLEMFGVEKCAALMRRRARSAEPTLLAA